MKLLNGKLLAFVVIAAGIMGSAFVINKNATEKKDPTFFFYILKPGGNPLVEEDYTVREEEMPSPCNGDSEVCWIIAEDNGNEQPDITGPLQTEIENALLSGIPSTNVELRN